MRLSAGFAGRICRPVLAGREMRGPAVVAPRFLHSGINAVGQVAQHGCDEPPLGRDVGDGFAAFDGVGDVPGRNRRGREPEHAFLPFGERCVHEPGAQIRDADWQLALPRVEAQAFQIIAHKRLGGRVGRVAGNAADRGHGRQARKPPAPLFYKIAERHPGHGREPGHVQIDGGFFGRPLEVAVRQPRARVDHSNIHAAHFLDQRLERTHGLICLRDIHNLHKRWPG